MNMDHSSASWWLTVKNLPAMQEMRVQSLGRKDHPEKGAATPLQYSRLENPMDGGAGPATVHGVAVQWGTT